jgi:hypothetical protein
LFVVKRTQQTIPSGLLRAQNTIHNWEDWYCRANIPPGETCVERGLPSKLDGRNLFQPGSVHRDEEQLKLASRFDESFEFVQPEGKRRHMAVGLSVIGGLLLAGFAISRLKTRREARKDVLKLFL